MVAPCHSTNDIVLFRHVSHVIKVYILAVPRRLAHTRHTTRRDRSSSKDRDMAFKMSTLLLQLAMIVGVLVWSPTYGRENKCEAQFQMSCVKRVSYFFNEKIIEEKREFRIEYKPQGQSEEVIADCQWRNEQLSCDPVRGIFCERQPSNIFDVVIDTAAKCLTDGEIRFDVAHEQLIRCELKSYKNASESNIQSNITQAAKTSGRGDENNVTIGAIAGVVMSLLTISAIVGICFWKKGKVGTKRGTKKANVENINEIEKQQRETFVNQGVEGNEFKGKNRSREDFPILQHFCIESTEKHSAREEKNLH